MTALNNIWIFWAFCTLGFVFYPDQAFGQANSNEVRNLTQSQDPSPGERNTGGKERDGQHDFDFLPGTWKVHNRRLTHPLSGSTTWVEFESTSVTKKVWDGRANMDEYEADSASAHIEGLTVRLYNPKSHQWSLYWANQANGTMETPTIGEFKNGRGDFYDQEFFQGRSIYVRYSWLDIKPNLCRWEQAFSADGGKTWETNWVIEMTRVGHWERGFTRAANLEKNQ
jgi:hypothetical protein